MGDRLLEGRAAQRLVARSSPPFDCPIVEPRLGEMMGDRLGLGVRLAQRLGRAAMERLAAALEQALVGSVWISACLETVFGLRGSALDKQQVGFGEPLQRCLQCRLISLGDVAQ